MGMTNDACHNCDDYVANGADDEVAAYLVEVAAFFFVRIRVVCGLEKLRRRIPIPASVFANYRKQKQLSVIVASSSSLAVAVAAPAVKVPWIAGVTVATCE